MRRFLIPALMISLLLAGCRGTAGTEQKIEEQRDRFAAAELSFTAEVTADLGSEVFECTLCCSASGDAVTVEVTAPENIAGVRAHIKGGETTLEYDGVQLVVGRAGTEGVSPVSAMPLLMSALRTGHVIRAWTEGGAKGELAAAEIYASDDCGITVWFDTAAWTPVYAELSVDGEVAVKCNISGFTVQ